MEEISPGEVRGSSIKGGKKIMLKAGDTVNIPPTTPHQNTRPVHKEI